MRSKTTPSASHNQGGSNLSAGDKIRTHITWMDADGNGVVQIDELASSLEPLLLWAHSVAVDRSERSTSRIGAKQGTIDGHPMAAPVS